MAKQRNNRAAWLRGPLLPCSQEPEPLRRPYRIVLLGAPGVGKGTQAQLLAERLGACHLSTGEIFRTAKSLAKCQCSPAMNEALRAMQEGALVADDTVLHLIRERRGCLCCGGGFILDGFPRTVAQARALNELLKEQEVQLDAVVDYRLPGQQLIRRLSGRRTCAGCKAVFHITERPPKHDGICDHCGSALRQREDDRPEAIHTRLDTYAAQTAPLTAFYDSAGLLLPIDASGSPEAVLQQTIIALWTAVE
jgi:adenylate kinase